MQKLRTFALLKYIQQSTGYINFIDTQMMKMKKQTVILFVTTILSCTAAHAQQKAGSFSITPKVGIDVSNFTGHMPAICAYAGSSPTTEESLSPTPRTFVGSLSFDENKSKIGFTAGVEAQYQFSNTFGLSLGIMYAQQGARYNTSGFTTHFGIDNKGVVTINNDLKANLHTITVPILANLYVWRGLAVKAGVQPEFIVSKKLDGDVSMSHPGNILLISDLSVDHLRSFSLSLPVGISYEYRNIVADCRYHIGLTNMMKNGDAGNSFSDNKSSRNSMLSFTLGYKFEL